jgi:hypothetical protein
MKFVCAQPPDDADDSLNVDIRATLEVLGVGVRDRGRRFAIHRVRRADLDATSRLPVMRFAMMNVSSVATTV